jgi:pimeloyl-ACP methyl ester carboxylesterase
MFFGGDLLAEAGVRLLTLDRPGMGGSTPDAGRTLASTVADYRVFVESVLDRAGAAVPVVANSQGSIFGLGAAAAGWASRLVLVSPQDEVAHPPVAALLSAEFTQLPKLAADNPDEAARILGGFTADAMEEMVLGTAAESDRAFYAEPAFLASYRRALAEGFANGGAGYVRDTLIAMRPWEVAFGAIERPVDILFGALDTGHSPDHGQILSRRIPNARREVVDGVGGALLWSRPETVIRRVLEA